MHRNGKRIVFTHGAFDLLHYGHLSFLRKSKKLGDVLIVGIESDKNVSSYKPGRPIITQKRRLELLSELNCVDICFINKEKLKPDTYEPFYHDLKANVVTAGRNFGNERVQEIVARTPAKFIFVDSGFESTTRIIDKIIASKIHGTDTQ
jgi:D-beta-D-heptose 7-phosphate kinase/D-beta-D-heptose 1-phosphate adenosyltransferase